MISNGSEPAYPTLEWRGDRGEYTAESVGGLTKRELFAVQIMPAVLAAYVEANGRCIGTDHVAYNSAAHAVRIADALLTELAKDPT